MSTLKLHKHNVKFVPLVRRDIELSHLEEARAALNRMPYTQDFAIVERLIIDIITYFKDGNYILILPKLK